MMTATEQETGMNTNLSNSRMMQQRASARRLRWRWQRSR